MFWNRAEIEKGREREREREDKGTVPPWSETDAWL